MNRPNRLLLQGKAIKVKSISVVTVLAILLSATPALAQGSSTPIVISETPLGVQPAPQCQEINKGGPIAGIVVASVFWWLLPMSIPVWITQTKKLRSRRAAIREQQSRGCP